MFKWDGTDIGDVSSHITNIEMEQNYVIINFKNNEKAYAFKFDNNIPLVTDELKILFGLPKVGRHKCIINDKKIILCRKICAENTLQENDKFNDNELQRIYVFRWALGLTLSSSLRIRKFDNGINSLLSYQEISIDYDNNNIRRSVIPDTIIKKYFNNRENLDILVKNMFPYNEFVNLRVKIDNIIRRVDKEYVWWNANIIERLTNKLM
jgi:hypothetical protein